MHKMVDSPRKASARKNPLFGAAVVKAVLRKRGGVGATSALYEGILRDLGLTDAEVEAYLADHAVEVEQAIKSHGRRGD
ncbi:MAG TPA: hypothetical protein VFL36_14470 [Myxococcales bacterium]|nr:hypothetical protein [Myxococcales bacterium]